MCVVVCGVCCVYVVWVVCVGVLCCGGSRCDVVHCCALMWVVVSCVVWRRAVVRCYVLVCDVVC